MKFAFISTAIAIATAAAISGIQVSAVHAQSSPPQDKQQQPTQSFSEQELQTFAEAAQEVTSIREEYKAKLQGASDAQEHGALQKEATLAMIGAVEKSGMSVERYTDISNAARSDPQVAQKVRRYMEEPEKTK